ncbi:MAG TPA: multicopper oxidase [Isosphaeraceae bacterium]|nr:multicopper oxidase [Isosphaeraceae bacterium]
MANAGTSYRAARVRAKAVAATPGAMAPAAAAPTALPPPFVGLLDPNVIPKYVAPLPIPRVMPRVGQIFDQHGHLVDYYEIAVRQFPQQVLPDTDIFGNTLAPTTVWGYGSVHQPATFAYPAYTIEARYQRAVRVKWINQLVERDDGEFLPHLLPVDQTLHWANPPGEPGPPMSGLPAPHRAPDQPGMSQRPYRGPVPIVTHVHGAHTTDDSDGYPEAWYLPAASNLPHDYFPVGSRYHYFQYLFLARHGVYWEPGTATYQYPNTQRATTLWYHDHSLGMTRANVYAGLAGFYILRGGADDQVRVTGTGTSAVLPGPAPSWGDPAGKRYYEIPVAIQDRTFHKDGSLFYPDSREYFERPNFLHIPYIPAPGCPTASGDPTMSDVSPILNPEFFGNTIVVNGRTWPFLEVEQRRYRLRILNGCNSRTLILKMEDGRPLWKIGSEGGFLRQPARCGQLVIAPAERADVILDFTDAPLNAAVKLLNVGPDSPFQGLNRDGTLYSSSTDPAMQVTPSDASTTGQVMEFRVIPIVGSDSSTPPDQLQLPPIAPLGTPTLTRRVSLNELDSTTVMIPKAPSPVITMDCDATHDLMNYGPIMALLGTLKADGSGDPRRWMDPITENPAVGATEVWEIHNLTVDAHPIHLHQVMFEVLEREYVDVPDVVSRGTSGTKAPADPAENGRKDTVIANPGEITRIVAQFDLAGLYVWHCHILEHEDNEMMRPLAVGATPPPASPRSGGSAARLS